MNTASAQANCSRVLGVLYRDKDISHQGPRFKRLARVQPLTRDKKIIRVSFSDLRGIMCLYTYLARIWGASSGVPKRVTVLPVGHTETYKSVTCVLNKKTGQRTPLIPHSPVLHWFLSPNNYISGHICHDTITNHICMNNWFRGSHPFFPLALFFLLE